jgi:uracil DNA glycosylase
MPSTPNSNLLSMGKHQIRWMNPKYVCTNTDFWIIISNLTAWADNGVLMLNTCLTVKANRAGSHSGKGWEEFTDKVVDVVDKYGGANLSSGGDSEMTGIGRGVVFLAWGSWAAKRVAKLNKVSSSRPHQMTFER